MDPRVLTLERNFLSTSARFRKTQSLLSSHCMLTSQRVRIHVTETQHGRPHSGRSKAHVADIATLEWHSLSVDEVLVRQGVSPNAGLDTAMAARRLSSNGANQLSPTPKHWLRRVFFYFFGGFGSLLCVAGTIAIIAWKPLGNPAPQVANLALGIVLYIVLLLQAFFNAWQGMCPCKMSLPLIS